MKGAVQGIITIGIILAIGVIFLDYVKNPNGPNQLAAIGGEPTSNLYNIAAGNGAALNLTGLSGFQS